MSATLKVSGLSKSFGVVPVAVDVSFETKAGECLGVIGPNGAGKTSLLNLLDGSIRPASGRIFLDGFDITEKPRHLRARVGVGRAFQIPKPFSGLSVFENVLAATSFGGGLSGAGAAERALEILETVGLAAKSETISGRLTLLDRKRLELAKAIGTGSKVLLLDEIAGGLTEQEVQALVEIVRSLKKERAIVWIEHIAHALLATADRIMVMHFGRKLIEGEPNSVMQNAEVMEIYLGISVDAAT